MLNEEPTPYINGPLPEEEEDQSQYQNMSQSDSLENIEYQQPMNEIIQNQTNQTNQNQNDIEDILQKTSVGNLNEFFKNPSRASVTQQNIEQQIENPVIQQVIKQPIILKSESLEENNNINNPQNICNTYSYPIVKNINNTHFSILSENNTNNMQATVHSMNKPFSSSENINDNDIYTQIQPDNDIGNSKQMVTQYSKYGNVDQNIITNTKTLPEVTTTIINDYKTENVLSDTINSTNIKGLTKYHAQVIPINEEKMENPKVAKTVRESHQHFNHHLSKSKKKNFDQKYINKEKQDIKTVRESQQHVNNFFSKTKNKNFDKEYTNKENKDINKPRFTKSKKITNNNNKKNRIYLNQRDLNDIKNFSPDFWRNFYSDEEESFFEPLKNNINIIKDQMIQNRNKNETYFGDINKQREKHGFGKLVTPEMERIGNWKNDEFNGWGREIRKNGEIYEGKFINGKLNGKGIYKNNSIFYIGNFINYIKDGKGELFTNNYHYVGNFRKNKMNGNGRIDLYNKGVYEGQFFNGEMNGYGIFKYNNGDYYDGQIKDGEMNGYGKLKQINGKILEGYFVDGVFKGEQNNENDDMYMYKDDD